MLISSTNNTQPISSGNITYQYTTGRISLIADLPSAIHDPDQIDKLTPNIQLTPFFLPEELRHITQHIPQADTVLLILAQLMNGAVVQLDAIQGPEPGIVLYRNPNKNAQGIIWAMRHRHPFDTKPIALEHLLYPQNEDIQLTPSAATVLSNVLIVFLRSCRQLPPYPLSQHARLYHGISIFTAVGHPITEVMRAYNHNGSYRVYPDDGAMIVFTDDPEVDSTEWKTLDNRLGLRNIYPETPPRLVETEKFRRILPDIIDRLRELYLQSLCDQKVISHTQMTKINNEPGTWARIHTRMFDAAKKHNWREMNYAFIANTIVEQVGYITQSWPSVDNKALHTAGKAWVCIAQNPSYADDGIG